MWQDDGDHIIDLDERSPLPPGPPVHGAQWDEVRRCWERWDDASGAWLLVGTGVRVPDPEVPLDLAASTSGVDRPPRGEPSTDHIIDVDRLAPPPQEVPGAQWNEVMGRWERWDRATAAWVAIPSDANAF